MPTETLSTRGGTSATLMMRPRIFSVVVKSYCERAHPSILLCYTSKTALLMLLVKSERCSFYGSTLCWMPQLVCWSIWPSTVVCSFDLTVQRRASGVEYTALFFNFSISHFSPPLSFVSATISGLLARVTYSSRLVSIPFLPMTFQ